MYILCIVETNYAVIHVYTCTCMYICRNSVLHSTCTSHAVCYSPSRLSTSTSQLEASCENISIHSLLYQHNTV